MILVKVEFSKTIQMFLYQMLCDTLTTRQRAEVSLHYNWPLRPKRSGAMMEEQSAVSEDPYLTVSSASHLAPSSEWGHRGYTLESELSQVIPLQSSECLVVLSRPTLDNSCLHCSCDHGACHPPHLRCGLRHDSDVSAVSSLLTSEMAAASPAWPAAIHLLSPLCVFLHSSISLLVIFQIW